jgi:hypothetical protein
LALSRLIYAQHTKIHSNAILNEEFSPNFARRPKGTGRSKGLICGKVWNYGRLA